MPVEVRDHPEEQRYEIFVDGELAGFSAYKQRPGILAVTHTELDDRFSGQGLGSKLVRGTLDDARSRDVAVLPFCEFVNGYIKRHEEYADLVPESQRGAFDL